MHRSHGVMRHCLSIRRVSRLMAVVGRSKPRGYRWCPCWYTGSPPSWVVYLGMVVVQLGFGLYPVLIKKFAGEVKANPLIVSFYRDVGCFPVLFLCAIVAERKILIPSWGMLGLFVLMGLFGMFGNQLLYLLGVYWASPNAASAFQPIIPVWTTLLALFTCTEKFPSPKRLVFWSKFLGVLIAAGGAVEITLLRKPVTESASVTPGDDNTSFMELLGYLSLFGNTLLMAAYVLIQKRFIFDKKSNKWREYPVNVTAYSYFFGALFMGLASIYYYNQPEVYVLPNETLYVLVFAIFITSALCYLLITWANMHISSILVTAFWPLQVLVAVTASWFITGDVLAPLQYIGGVMLIIGLFFVLWSSYQEQRDIANGKDQYLDLLKCVRQSKAPLSETTPLINSAKGNSPPPSDPPNYSNIIDNGNHQINST